jgi:hypothetical protein
MPPQPTITRCHSEESDTLSIRWSVDARKLRVKDKVAVSPSFELVDGVPGTFRLMLYPKAVSDRKGGASFKKAKGKGSVHVKCESPEGSVHDGIIALRISVGSGGGCISDGSDLPQQEAPRGPVMHNFAESGICSLPSEQEEWDFGKATDDDTQNFIVCLEILNLSQLASS